MVLDKPMHPYCTIVYYYNKVWNLACVSFIPCASVWLLCIYVGTVHVINVDVGALEKHGNVTCWSYDMWRQ